MRAPHGTQTIQSNTGTGGAIIGEGRDRVSGGKRRQGSEIDHRSDKGSVYHNCTDGAADEMGRIDEEIRRESKTERKRDVCQYCSICKRNTLICIVLRRKLSFHL